MKNSTPTSPTSNSANAIRASPIKNASSKRMQASKSKQFTAVDFTFDATKQVYRCPHGKELTCHARDQINRHRTYDVYHARVDDCAVCPLRSRCLSKADTSRRYLSIQVDTQQPNLIDEMKAKINSEQGKRIYARRLGIIEPVFSNICVQKRMHRFTLRSKRKVDVQWTRTRSLWFTISAKSTPLGRSPKPIQTLATCLNAFRLNIPPLGTLPHL